MASAPRMLLALLGLALIGAGVAWLRWGIEWVDEVVDIGFGEEARRNEFLAAELFIRAQGLEAETVIGAQLLDELPPPTDLIVLSATREYMSERRRDALREWLEAGGQLVVRVDSVWDESLGASDDPLLDGLGVFLLDPETLESTPDAGEDASGGASSTSELAGEPEEVPAEETDGDEHRERPPTLGEIVSEIGEPSVCVDASRIGTFVQVSGTERPLLVELSGDRVIAVSDERSEAAYIPSSGQLIVVPIGQGWLMGLTSFAPFTNDRIHCHDHAFLFHFLLDGVRKVWLLHDPDLPSLTELVRTHLPMTTLGGILLLGSMLAASSIRFGVPDVDGSGPRRALREHLEATIAFLHRHGGFAALIDRLRRELDRPHGSGRRSRDLDRWASRAGIEGEQARWAIKGEIPRQGQEIIAWTQAMLRLRRTR